MIDLWKGYFAMAVFGAGAFYYDDDNSGVDVTKDFLEQECFCIGYEKKEASALYEMLRRVKIGDIVYLKSFKVGKKGESGTIFIKAIGFVIGQNIKSFTFSDGSNMGYGRGVKWIKDFSDREDWFELELNPEERVNNVYSNTMYEEYSARVITTVIDLLVE